MKISSLIKTTPALALLFTLSCGIFQPQDQSAHLLLQIRQAEPETLAKAQTSIDSMQCIVQRNNKIVYNEILRPENGRFQNDIKLDPGNGYSVSLLGRHQSVTVGQAYEDSIDLNQGETRTVVLTWNVFTVKLLQPGSDSLLFQNKTELAWQDCPGAVSYDLQIDDQQDFAAPEVNESALTATEFKLETPLSAATWHWRVRPRDEQDTPGRWSNSRTFSVDTRVPAAPELISPVDQSVLSSPPTLEWQKQQGIQSWHVRLDDQPGFSSPESQDSALTVPSFLPDSLNDGLYYWQVRASRNGKWSDWSDVWRFTLDTRGPEAPSLTQPADGSVLDTDTPTLSWQQVSEAQTYEVVIDTRSAFTAPVARDTALNETLYTPSSLDDASYVWRVRACDAQGHWGAWSEIWSFVVDARVPEAPELQSPTDGSVVADSLPEFSWYSVDATGYNIRIYSDGSFASPFIADRDIVKPEYTVQIALPDSVYRWQVRGSDSHGNWGDWSETWSFSIDTQGPDAPPLMSPINDTTLIDSIVTFKWSFLDDASAYELQVCNEQSFTNPEIHLADLTSTESPGNLITQGIWYWRVRAVDMYGNYGSWSQIWYFKIPERGKMTDQDGNVYKTIKIGDQWWMAENLKVTHFRNGDLIPNITSNSEWINLSSCAYCAYGNDENNTELYGYLYNWFAVKDPRVIAPEGWHVPTDEEWKKLINFLGGPNIAGVKLKDKGTEYWQDSDEQGTNESRFTALPSGLRYFEDGIFYELGQSANYWSSSQAEPNQGVAWSRTLSFDSKGTSRDYSDKRRGFSIRCIKNGSVQPSNTPNASFSISHSFGTTETIFTFDASGCTDAGDAVSALQVRWDWENDGIWDTGYSTTKTATHTFVDPGTKTVKLQVVDSGGLTDSTTRQVTVLDANYETGMVTDIDGNTYQTVKIGDQWWMAENLRVTHYRNGDAIHNVTIDSEWQALASGAYCAYDNLESNAHVYGYLYNWYAVDNTRNIAPEGWHVPTDEEWKELEMALGMSLQEAGLTGWRGTDEGGKLKATGIDHWTAPNTGATNASGFGALPSGFRDHLGEFHKKNNFGYFWSCTGYDIVDAWCRYLYHDHADIYRNNDNKRYGFPVRCIKGEHTPITNTAPQASFAISPDSGTTETTFTFDASDCSDAEDATSGLQVRWDWENDGNWDTEYSTSKTATHQYSTKGTRTINMEVIDTEGLTDTFTLDITVSEKTTGTVTDIDGNTYKTIKIGDQWWMAENLKVTHYSNGDTIPNVTSNSEWMNLESGAYCAYDNSESNAETFGYLYNWYAVDDSRNIAPEGWHVPTDDEWKELEMALGMSQSKTDIVGWRGNNSQGSKLADNASLWSDGDLKNNSAFGASGFNALPGGYSLDNRVYDDGIGNDAYFWSSSESYSYHAWYRHLNYSSTYVGRNERSKRTGFSIRCVRD
ncbi:MAG: FISUMP domain-containing protein [candidate division KSB1 bacterium]|nr:FISUMP domain-containing protein [candidate division KSB1 bacterium]